RLRGRSFMAFVLAPLPPIHSWLAELDNWSRSSPGFFAGRPIILDLAAAPLDADGIAELIQILAERGIRVMGLEGVEPAQLGASLPPLLKGGRAPAAADAVEPSPRTDEREAAAPPQSQEPNSLLLESPIRSGQSIIFPYGDVTVLGSVSSGAEVVAG